jgi:CheY-like chemotaxis protein
MAEARSQHSSVAEISEQLRTEFIDEAVESIQALEMTLDNGKHNRVPHVEVVNAFRRTALSLRGQAANFGCRSLAAVAHRLDEYLAGAPIVLPPRAWDDLLLFTDVMQKLVRDDGSTGDISALVRRLPPKLGFNLGDIEVRNVEVILVMPHGAQTHYVERELQQCGYRVSIVPDTIMAFSMVIQTKPDLVVISAVMPELDGLDLAIALAAMPSTRNIPIAIITSLDPADDRLQLLPKRIPVVHKGASFGDDLFSALDNLFLI